jgi:hypothetical protein
LFSNPMFFSNPKRKLPRRTLGAGVTAQAPLALHEGDRPDPAVGRGRGPFDEAMVLRGRCLLLIPSGVVLAVAGLVLLPVSRLRRACSAVGALLGPFGGSAPVAAPVARRNRHPDQLLDIA